MPTLNNLGALTELANRQGWGDPAMEDYGGLPLAGLGGPAPSLADADPFERAAYRQRETARPSGGRYYDPERAIYSAMLPQSPLDVGLMALGGPFGKLAKIAAVAGGAALTSGEAEAGPLAAMRKLPLWFWEAADKATPRIGLGQFETTSPGRILNATRKTGGYSVNLPSGEIPQEGLMMGVYGNTDPRNLVIAGRAPTLADIGQHAETNLAALQRENRFFGTWRDPETGTTYLDVSQKFPPQDIRTATKFGERTGQLAGFNVGTKQSFPVGNWADFIKSPEFHQRMQQMAQEGNQYLSQFPTKEWWDMRGGPFEQVYGTQNMPQTAGFTASTAPNAQPRENLQTMSEYMRRYIRGEPVVQPDWRVPEGAMSRQPGVSIGMEASRIPNLQKSAAGQYTQLQRDKVREEALALMGDPNAVVLDRHWARISEAPERGIFASSEEGVVPSAPRASGPTSYQLMKGEVVDAAKRANRDPRDFSADAWTGIRKTIQETNQLFGQPFSGASVRGESKSYADHFVDLMREKASHLGITLQEMEKRLRSGDANLLSTMLGAPTIAAAYRYWDAGQGGQSPGQNAPASTGNSPGGARTLQQ